MNHNTVHDDREQQGRECLPRRLAACIDIERGLRESAHAEEVGARSEHQKQEQLGGNRLVKELRALRCAKKFDDLAELIPEIPIYEIREALALHTPLAEDDLVHFGPLGGEPHEAGYQLLERLHGRQRRIQGCEKLNISEDLVHRRVPEPLLGFEMAVNQRLRDTGRTRDSRRRRAVEAVVGERADRRGKDLLPAPKLRRGRLARTSHGCGYRSITEACQDTFSFSSPAQPGASGENQPLVHHHFVSFNMVDGGSRSYLGSPTGKSTASLRRANSAAQVSALLDDELDLALSHVPLADDRIRLEPVQEERLYAILPENHSAAKGHSVSWAMLEGETHIVLSRSVEPEVVRTFQDVARNQGERRPKIIEVEDVSLMFTLVAAGLGISHLPEDAIRLGFRGVVALPIAPAVSVPLYAARAIESRSPVAEALLTLLRSSS